MNFLAHIYLSGENNLTKIGNFMADGIRGNQLDHFPPNVRKGILLHRAIDTFTDAHAVFRQSTKRLHPTYSHYAGVIVDIYYDHFLAKNWQNYSTLPLADYVTDFYNILEYHYAILTNKTQQLTTIMKAENWLLMYADIDGIRYILTQMDKRTGNASGMRLATTELIHFYTDFEQEFIVFFKELQIYAHKTLQTL